MRRQVAVGLAILLTALAGGLVVTWVVRGRALQDRVYCGNHLRELGQTTLSDPGPGADRKPRREVPAGTVARPGVPPERRLNWLVPSLPVYPHRGIDRAAVRAAFDLNQPADADVNRAAGRAVLPGLFCPAAVPIVPADALAPTMYPGSAGLGADAGTLPPGHPRAGAFRYDLPTPHAAITDGLSGTLLFTESRPDGAWSVGGPGTVRGILDDQPLFGADGQFGAGHAGGANFGFADGSVRFLVDQISPAYLRRLATSGEGAGEVD